MKFVFIIFFTPFLAAETAKESYSQFVTYLQLGPIRIMKVIDITKECVPKEPSLAQTTDLLSQTIEEEPVESSILKDRQTYHVSLHPLDSEITRGDSEITWGEYESYGYGGLLLFQPKESGLYRIWVSNENTWIGTSSLDKNTQKQLPLFTPIFEILHPDDSSIYYRKAVQQRFEGSRQKYIIQLNSHVDSFHLWISALKESESKKCVFWSVKKLLDEYDFLFNKSR